MSVKITDRFAEQCSVVVGNNYDTCGTVTRATINHLTPAQLEALFAPDGLFADMDAWFRTAIEMKACGTRTYGMYDWIMSSADRGGKALMNTMRAKKGPSLLQPFILARQDSVINTDFWNITNGIANSGYTGNAPGTAIGTISAGPLTTADKALGSASDRIVRVINQYGVDLDSKWFLNRDVVHIFTRTAGVSEDGAWKVLASAVSTDRSYVDVLITSQNGGSSSSFKAAPTSGVLLPGINNVNDFESWCSNRPTLDPRKRVPFWYQTRRRTRCVDSEYEKVYARLIESNEAFKEFGDLPLAERNRQDEHIDQVRVVNAFFFNKPISANQTLALWEDLEDIETVTGASVDPGTGGKLIAKRANFIGVKEQLIQCDRYRDLKNQKLNFYEWLDENYNIMRARKSQGRKVTDLDWFTDSAYKAEMTTAFMQYYKNESLEQFRINMELGKTDNIGLGFAWDSFYVKRPSGVRINIITHEFFDDLLDAFVNSEIESRGRVLLCLDIGKPGANGGTIYPVLLESNRKVHTVGELNDLARIDSTFACTMENVKQEITLTSETMTVIVECPANSLWIENIAGGVPVTSGRTTPYGDLY